MLCVVLLVLFAVLSFRFRHSRPWLLAWASVILVFFVVSFGLDLWLLPAGMMALFATILPRRVTSTPDETCRDARVLLSRRPRIDPRELATYNIINKLHQETFGAR